MIGRVLLLLLLVCLGVNAKDADITEYHKEIFGEINFNEHGIATIVTPDGWIAIDRKHKTVYRPFPFDNGPDPEQEGFIRFVENKKMGFVNSAGRIVIPAKFDFVYPFENGRALYCNGCKTIRMGEHSMLDEKTGHWGEVDRRGRKYKRSRKGK
jgi:hypothetical protein